MLVQRWAPEAVGFDALPSLGVKISAVVRPALPVTYNPTPGIVTPATRQLQLGFSYAPAPTGPNMASSCDSLQGSWWYIGLVRR